MTHPTVLLVEDTEALARVYIEFLRDEPIRLIHAATGKEAMNALAAHSPTAVILDLRLPDMDGLDILRHIKANGVPAQVVVITAHGSINVAVEAMRAGAFDFIVKPFNSDRLIFTLRNALELSRLASLVETLADDYTANRFGGFIGSSPAMQAVYRTIDSVARSKATVFVTGESGTGKELCAEAIHQRSPRAQKPFVALNCGAIPKELMESEIFGHVKGAFTGALSEREGAAARAHGGTLFLDEICEMELGLQAKLLRFVQTGTYQKVGSDQIETVDIRFVCATNRDPVKEMREGRFREDLFYRLHVIPIHLPPLRERDDDVIEIARAFLAAFAVEENKAFAAFAPDVEARFKAHAWPGNVRELQNVVRNIAVLNDGDTVTQAMLPAALAQLAPARISAASDTALASPAGVDGIRPLWMVEKEAIEKAIAACEGNVPRAAALLGISPSTIYRKKLGWEEGENAEFLSV